MSITTATHGTPRFVLMDGNHRIGPELVESGDSCAAIYGFSHKSHFDTFCEDIQITLKPYPLVRTYLRNQADTKRDCLNLIVIDAANLSEPCLDAVTIEAVLEARENQSELVTATHHLTYDSAADAYRVEEAAV